jgi:hypothetical protein
MANIGVTFDRMDVARNVIIFVLLVMLLGVTTSMILTRLSSLEAQVVPVANERLRAVDYRLDRIDQRLDRIEARLSVVAERERD